MNTKSPSSFSKLGYKTIESPDPGESDHGTLIALHGHRQSLDLLLDFGALLVPQMRVEAPEAARGVYRSIRVIGKTWFGGSISNPEPASFGDSLAQIEMFIHDAQQRAGTDAPKPWLLGYEQGAVLALTIAVIAPDLVSGVMAIDGGLPQFSDPSLIQPMESNLPVLLIGDASREESGPSQEATATALRDLGCQVDLSIYNDAGTFPDGVRDALRNWLQRQSGN